MDRFDHDSGRLEHRWLPALRGTAFRRWVTLIVMVRNSSRGNVVFGWPFVGLLGLGFVYVIADAVLH
jgi:hypothetical protein